MRQIFYASASIMDKPTRVYFRDGECLTGNADVLDTLFIRRVSYTGQKRRQMRLMNVVPLDLLGIQNVSDIPKAPPKLDESGAEIIKKKRNAPVSPDLIKNMIKLAEQNKTIKEACEELREAYHVILKISKQEGITFKKGKKGRAAKEGSKPVDETLLNNMKALTAKTLKDAAKVLEMPYAKLYVIAKKEKIVFAKSQRGRVKKA